MRRIQIHPTAAATADAAAAATTNTLWSGIAGGGGPAARKTGDVGRDTGIRSIAIPHLTGVSAVVTMDARAEGGAEGAGPSIRTNAGASTTGMGGGEDVFLLPHGL
eukprot:gene49717-47287_t